MTGHRCTVLSSAWTAQAARPPRGEQHEHGLLLLQQRGHRGPCRAGRRRAQGPHPRLGRAPRQRCAVPTSVAFMPSSILGKLTDMTPFTWLESGMLTFQLLTARCLSCRHAAHLRGGRHRALHVTAPLRQVRSLSSIVCALCRVGARMWLSSVPILRCFQHKFKVLDRVCPAAACFTRAPAAPTRWDTSRARATASTSPGRTAAWATVRASSDCS